MAGMHKQLTYDKGAMDSVKVHDFDFVLEITWPSLAAVFLQLEQLPIDPIQQQFYVHSIGRHLPH